jgi:uncharacterized Zn-finger protein
MHPLPRLPHPGPWLNQGSPQVQDQLQGLKVRHPKSFLPILSSGEEGTVLGPFSSERYEQQDTL